MSILSSLVTRIEQLMLGTYGTTHVMEPDRFRLLCDVLSKNVPDNIAERSFQVVITDMIEHVPVNHYDGFGIYNVDFEVWVHYVKTNAGEDNPETATTEGGSGTINSIYERSILDLYDVVRVLTYHENCGGMTPNIIGIDYKNNSSYDERDTMLTRKIPFKAMMNTCLTTGV